MNLRIEEIEISPTRQRREFDPKTLQDLADSIDRNGLLQPIVVRAKEGGYGWVLVCGERRIRAIRDYLLPLGSHLRHAHYVLDDGNVPAVDFGELDPLAAEEAELEENIRRVDLTWQERAAATARLALLRGKQRVQQGAVEPSIAEISLEVRGASDDYARDETRKEILISKHLGNPTVAAAKSLEEAWKALKRGEEAERNVRLAEAVGRTFTADLHQAVNMDCVEWMENCPDGCLDVILTDPPYGIDADQFGDQGGHVPVGAHGYKDSKEGFDLLMNTMWKHFIRIAKPQAHLYVFCDIDRFVEIRDDFEAAGWNCFRTPLIWHKPNGNRAPWPEHGPHRKYELILYAMKGKRPVTKLYPDVLTYPADSNLGHMAQKPVALFEDLLKRSVRPGDSVFDPFMGTGTIFPAAHALKCQAVGIELDPAAYGIALRRIQSLKEEE